MSVALFLALAQSPSPSFSVQVPEARLEAHADHALVLAPPVADFSAAPTSGAAPLPVDFTDLSTGAITSWSWDFGDGATSGIQTPSYTYPQPGTFPVTLTVSGPGGSDSLTRTNYVLVDPGPPTADFSATPTSGMAPLSVTFSDVSQGLIDTWSWDFGDGGTESAPFTGHTYTVPGLYHVTLTVTGAGGSDSESKFGLIDVQPAPPSASFSATPSEGAAPLLVNFSDTSSGTVTSWSWDFGDGLFSSEASPAHSYAAAGGYTATLTINGGASSATQSIVVHVAAQASVRNGSGVNALVYQSSLPVLGQSWSATIDASAHPNADLTLVLVRSQAAGGIPSAFGEILLNPASARLVMSTVPSGGGLATHNAPIPFDLAYEGFFAATQGVILGGTRPELTNAIDLVLGF